MIFWWVFTANQHKHTQKMLQISTKYLRKNEANSVSLGYKISAKKSHKILVGLIYVHLGTWQIATVA